MGARESVWCPPEDTCPDSDWTMVGRTGAITRFYWFLEPRRVAHEVLRVQQFSCLEKAGGRAGGEGTVFAGGITPRLPRAKKPVSLIAEEEHLARRSSRTSDWHCRFVDKHWPTSPSYLDQQHSLPRMDRDLSQPACPHAPVFDFEEILLAQTNPRDKWAHPRLALSERGSTSQTYNGFLKRPFP